MTRQKVSVQTFLSPAPKKELIIVENILKYDFKILFYFFVDKWKYKAYGKNGAYALFWLTDQPIRHTFSVWFLSWFFLEIMIIGFIFFVCIYVTLIITDTPDESNNLILTCPVPRP